MSVFADYPDLFAQLHPDVESGSQWYEIALKSLFWA